MSLTLTEEQELLRHTAREFVVAKSPLPRVRRLREDGTGFSRALWQEMAALGWAGIVFPEAVGGSGMGWSDVMVVLEELGRGLVPEPLVSTVLLGANAILLGGDAAQRAAHLPAVVAGERLVGLAWQEARSRYDHCHVLTRAARQGGGWRLDGEKHHVLDGHVADWFVVSVRTAGGPGDAAGIALVLVPRDARGVMVERHGRLDGRGAATVRLDGVEVGADGVLGDPATGGTLLGQVLDRATIALTAEMLGGMCAAYEMTLDYLKTRKQFGVPIGSFQALKHRAARLFIETELARSVVMAAHQAIDAAASAPAPPAETAVARLASIAKARCSDAFMLIGNEGVQMHGGIGMTDEHDVGLYLKRARATELTFGDAAFHRARLATLDGY